MQGDHQDWTAGRGAATIPASVDALNPRTYMLAIMTNDALPAGLKQGADLIDAAQAIIADHVRPNGLSAEDALFKLLELLDNTIVVERQEQWRAAIHSLRVAAVWPLAARAQQRPSPAGTSRVGLLIDKARQYSTGRVHDRRADLFKRSS